MVQVDPSSEEGRLRALATYSGDPWTPENDYFRAAEVHFLEMWRTVVEPFVADCDFTAVIDLAAGHGRNAQVLAPRAKRLLVLDIQPGNVEVCRRRFAGQPHVECAVNNGYDLRPAESRSFTFVYCFDSMVHFDPDVVRAYLQDVYRVLRIGGRGFFHHSNHAGGKDWRTGPHGRNSMTKELFARYAKEAGLRLVRQRLLGWGDPKEPWGHIPELDCLTIVAKPWSLRAPFDPLLERFSRRKVG